MTRSVALHVGQLLQPVPGGIGRYVAGLAGALADSGSVVNAFAAGPRPAVLSARVAYEDLGWPRGGLRYEAWHRFRRPAVAVTGDVLHAPSLAVAPPGGRPLVVSVHDLVFLRYPEHLTRRGVAFHRRGLAVARAEAAAIVVPTDFVRGDLLSEGFEPDRVYVAHHGVDPHVPGTPGERTEVLARLDIRRPFVLHVGTIEPRKGIDDVLAAHQRLRGEYPDLGLVFAGAQGWGAVPDWDRPGVSALGAVDDSTLATLYRSAEALVVASRYEGFGLPLIEAMAQGCPVVASDVACLPEVVGGAGVHFAVGDVDDLAQALASVLSDSERATSLAEAGLARANSFTWVASAAAHLDAYAAALESVARHD